VRFLIIRVTTYSARLIKPKHPYTSEYHVNRVIARGRLVISESRSCAILGLRHDSSICCDAIDVDPGNCHEHAH
jgi:hypothetical protein